MEDLSLNQFEAYAPGYKDWTDREKRDFISSKEERYSTLHQEIGVLIDLAAQAQEMGDMKRADKLGESIHSMLVEMLETVRFLDGITNSYKTNGRL